MPYAYELALPGESDHDFGLRAAKAIEDAILEAGADTVAAFIGEPVMGAGGVKIPPASYWPEVQRICRKYDVLLVADEVVCGFGRTGHWFGSERFGIEPDVMTVAKGLSSGYVPIAAVLLGPRVGDALAMAHEEWAHGFTYSGHPVAAAVALENLRIIEAEGLYDRAGGPLATISPKRSRASPITRWSARRAAAGCSARSSWSRTRQRAAISRAGARSGSPAASTASRTASSCARCATS
jgi:adenosylmethionine-8-amino-7-oxononanoate aminotransferase